MSAESTFYTSPPYSYFQPGTLPNPILPPERLPLFLNQIPKLEDVRERREQLRVSKITDKPYAMDLADEVRRVQMLLQKGSDPFVGWENFKILSEFYAKETYGKFLVTHYRHELVDDNGKLRLWIGAQEMLALDSYALALEKGGPDWYQNRCEREVQGIHDWEVHLQQDPNQVTFEISPAPFEVPETSLDTTSFGTHSFVRFHQMVRDNAPYMHSVAFRVNLPPFYLEQMYEKFSGEGNSSWQEMLGKFVFSNLQGVDIRDDRWIASIQQKLEETAKNIPPQERLPDGENILSGCLPEEMHNYFKEFEPDLKTAFDKVVDAAISGNGYVLQEALLAYQDWEKLIKARVNGDWDRQVRKFSADQRLAGQDYFDREKMLRMTIVHFQSQPYQPPAGSCGAGSGGADNLLGSSSFTVNSGLSSVFSDKMTTGGEHQSVASEACVTCPYCNNEKGNSKRGGRYICGNNQCPSNTKH